MKLSQPNLISCAGILLLFLALNSDLAFGLTKRVSVDSANAQGNGTSYYPAITPDGRYVGFGSSSTNLITNDTNSKFDTFIHDRQTGTTTRVSVSSSGEQGDDGSYLPCLSSDGRHVAFNSNATNLVANDTNGITDIFVHDRQTGTTTRISVNSSGEEANNGCGGHSISSDGRYVAFNSSATNLVANDTNGYTDVFVHDRQTGTTTRVSVHSNGAQGNNISGSSSISSDGRYVAFNSSATNLVANDTNGYTDVFVHDRQTGTTTRVSVHSNGAQGNSSSNYPYISLDGRFVAFQSDATDLVASDTNGVKDIFVHDRQTGTTTRVSLNSSGEQANDSSAGHSISPDGQHVVFGSIATNLVDNDSNGYRDIFVHNRQTGNTKRASVDSSGVQSNNDSHSAVLSSGGQVVALYSYASNLVPNDTNGQPDIFIRIDEGSFYVIPNAQGGISIIYLE